MLEIISREKMHINAVTGIRNFQERKIIKGGIELKDNRRISILE